MTQRKTDEYLWLHLGLQNYVYSMITIIPASLEYVGVVYNYHYVHA